MSLSWKHCRAIRWHSDLVVWYMNPLAWWPAGCCPCCQVRASFGPARCCPCCQVRASFGMVACGMLPLLSGTCILWHGGLRPLIYQTDMYFQAVVTAAEGRTWGAVSGNWKCLELAGKQSVVHVIQHGVVHVQQRNSWATVTW